MAQNLNGMENSLAFYGIHEEYIDNAYNKQRINENTASALKQALINYEAPVNFPTLLSYQIIQKSADEPEVKLNILVEDLSASCKWELKTENNKVYNGICEPGSDGKCILNLSLELDYGYHEFFLPDFGHAKQSVIIAPHKCYLPPEADHQKFLGISLQVYSLQSESKFDYGIGSLADLKALIPAFKDLGIDFIGLNPFHALPADEASPYSPSSREFYNFLYLDLPLSSDQDDNSELINYEKVYELKIKALKDLFEDFYHNDYSKETPKGLEFKSFIQSENAEKHNHLAKFASFCALKEYFGAWGWKDTKNWPAEHKYFKSESTQQFLEKPELQKSILFWSYTQFLFNQQMQEINELCADMKIGLYWDLAIGTSQGGAETWPNTELDKNTYLNDINLGAPPDGCSLQGQNWGLAAYNPFALKNLAYKPFINLLRANLKYAGALRIDHFIGFKQIFCIPNNCEEGAYLNYPFEDLLAILALESHRQKCLIIAEDLGIIPEGLPEAMRRANILSYKVFCIERCSNNLFKKPTDFDYLALITFATHDLATLKGFWTDHSLQLQKELNLFTSDETYHHTIYTHKQAKLGLLKALNLPEELIDNHTDEFMEELFIKVSNYMAESNCLLMNVQIEDLIGQTAQINLPGTVYPQFTNWRKRLKYKLSDYLKEEKVQKFFKALRKGRNNE